MLLKVLGTRKAGLKCKLLKQSCKEQSLHSTAAVYEQQSDTLHHIRISLYQIVAAISIRTMTHDAVLTAKSVGPLKPIQTVNFTRVGKL